MRQIRLKEKRLSWALYHPVNNQPLKQTLQNITGKKLKTIVPVARELPVLLEMKMDYTLSGYATGCQVHLMDLLVYGREDHRDYLFVIEVKNRAAKNSPKQAMKYVAGLLNTLIPNAHHRRGEIYQFYLEQVFKIKQLDHLIDRIREGKGRPLKIIPLLLAEKAPYKAYSSQVKFTKGLIKTAQEKNLPLPREAVVHQLGNSAQLIHSLARARAEEIKSLYADDPSFAQAADRAVKQRQVIKFSTTEQGTPQLFLLPSGKIKLQSRSRAVRYSSEYHPLQILQALRENSGGKFYLQFFLNGTNNPVYYLQIEDQKYLAFQHRDPYTLNCNGAFNQYIARDCKPIRKQPEAGDVFCLAQGQYFTSKDQQLKGLALRLTLAPDQIHPPTSQPPSSFYTLLLTPKVNQARADNQVRPFLSNKQALNILDKTQDQKQIFQYNPANTPLIHTGIRIKQ
ncbi:MAG: hypothetical protein ACOC6G_00225 [Thermoproteota archaeon]